MNVRGLRQDDFEWLRGFDCSPLHVERDSIYLFFCVHFAATSFVAEDAGGVPRGFVLGFVPAGAPIAYVHYLFVQEDWRRHGMGRLLMERFERAAGGVGAAKVVLFTRRASAFYDRIGYEVQNPIFEPAVADYLRDVKTVQVMARTL